MKKLSIRMKLSLGFGVLLLLMAIMAVVSYTSIQKLSDLTDQEVKQSVKTQYALAIDSNIELQLSATRGFVIAGQDHSIKRWKDAEVEFGENAAKLQPLLQTARGKALRRDERSGGRTAENPGESNRVAPWGQYEGSR